MSNTCSHCSRVSPVDAIYCYFDGAVLSAAYGERGPVKVGTQPFPAPFVFPGGQTCRNFDQLALACQNHWKVALEVLQEGYLEKFLAGMGRSDLAGAAREAARFPDRDRGLDQFLAKLPSDAIKPPLLAVEPTEINLGQVTVGTERSFELRLENRGMRLIYGSISSDSLWLALGGRSNSTQKLFEFGDHLSVPIQIRAKHLRARNKPQQAKLVIDSNAGRVEVLVKMEVPVKPYPNDVFAGVRSPRQLAEKAKEKPKEAAVLFESGAVARWYQDNNWTYPVQGPAASGLGAVQQFFEALGLTPAPKVEISERAVALSGSAGGRAMHQLEVRTREKRPIYAHGVSDQTWLTVMPAQLHGRSATIQLVVNRIPDDAGQTLQANVTIRSNGNQRFVVPVSLTIDASANPFTTTTEKTPMISSLPTRRGFLHLVPAALLGMSVSGVVAYDLLTHREQGEGYPPPPPRGGEEGFEIDPVIRLGVSFNERQRFGFVTLDEKDPNYPDKFKRLTYKEDGSYNNTCIKIDGDENLYGQAPGQWARDDKTRRPLNNIMLIPRRKWISAWEYPGRVRVTQTVMVVPNDDTRPAKLNTALVHYRIENRDNVPHKVGIRIMLDTYIGGNDGVPFALAGRDQLVTTKIDLQNTKDIPEFIQALERPNLADAGTKATMVLKFADGFRLSSNDPPLDPIVRLIICRFPGNPEIRWDVPQWDMNDKARGEQNDSCVLLYWPEQVMPPHTARTMAFTYGLGSISPVGPDASLALYTAAKPKPGSTFTVSAWVKNPRLGQSVMLHLPAQMSFVDAGAATQTVAKANTELGQVSWKVKVARDAQPGLYKLTGSMAGKQASVQVPVRENPDKILFQ
jgi:hypothetical protein